MLKCALSKVCAPLAIVCPLVLAVSAVAHAAPPPGHPSPAEGMHLMQPLVRPADVPLTRSGRVLSHRDANEYTYVEVSERGETLWLAAPRTPIADGSMVRFPDGVVMRDFYSKVLKRSFPAVIFVHAVESTSP